MVYPFLCVCAFFLMALHMATMMCALVCCLVALISCIVLAYLYVNAASSIVSGIFLSDIWTLCERIRVCCISNTNATNLKTSVGGQEQLMTFVRQAFPSYIIS